MNKIQTKSALAKGLADNRGFLSSLFKTNIFYYWMTVPEICFFLGML